MVIGYLQINIMGMGRDLTILKHGSHFLMSCHIELLYIGTVDVNSAVGIIIILRNIHRISIFIQLACTGKQKLTALCRVKIIYRRHIIKRCHLLLMGSLIFFDLPVYVKGSLRDTENLFAENINKTTHSHEILGIRMTSSHHILRTVHGILDLIQIGFTDKRRDIPLQGKGHRQKNDHGKD